MPKGKQPEDDEASEEGGPKSSFEVYRAEADMLFKNGQYRKAIESYSTVSDLATCIALPWLAMIVKLRDLR